MQLRDFLIYKPHGTYLRCRVCGATAWDALADYDHNGGCPALDWLTAAKLREHRVDAAVKIPFVQPDEIKPITAEGVKVLMEAQCDGTEAVYFTYAPQMRELCRYALIGMAGKAQPTGLTFSQLRAANVARLPLFKNSKGQFAHSKPDGSDWSSAQWLQAVIGELGEYANIRKKYERGDLSFKEYAPLAEMELADVMTYLDILALRALDESEGDFHISDKHDRFLANEGIDLGEAVRVKFNLVSERVGCSVRL